MLSEAHRLCLEEKGECGLLIPYQLDYTCYIVYNYFNTPATINKNDKISVKFLQQLQRINDTARAQWQPQ